MIEWADKTSATNGERGFSLVSLMTGLAVLSLSALAFTKSFDTFLTVNRQLTSSATFQGITADFQDFIRQIVDDYTGGATPCTRSQFSGFVNNRFIGAHTRLVYTPFLPRPDLAPEGFLAAIDRCESPNLPMTFRRDPEDTFFHFCVLIRRDMNDPSSAAIGTDDFLKGNNVFAEIRVDLIRFDTGQKIFCDDWHRDGEAAGRSAFRYNSFLANYSVYWSWSKAPGEPQIFKSRHGSFFFVK